MDNFADGKLDQLLKGLGLIYTHRWVVPFILLPIMVAVAFWVRNRAIKRTKPYLAISSKRVAALEASLGEDKDPISERAAFASNYMAVSQALTEEEPAALGLVQAWREFQESIVDETASPIRNTNRPSMFFNHAAPKHTELNFASNIFVGVGLILTFLGLIVALDTAAKGMSGGDIEGARKALTDLLDVAGAKFFTSVGGIGCSIWLRSVEHKLTHQLRKNTNAICGLLERGLLYVPPQKLAVEQLEVMKEQRDQLLMFNTDVAMQLTDRIGAQFHSAIAPVAQSLSQLNDNMISVTQGIGAGAREAIEKVSGEQLRGLSETLGQLSTRLDAISTAVSSSGDEAGRQIRAAGEDFAKAASDIRTAFDTLAGNVEGMGGKLAEQGEAMATAQSESLKRILGDLENAQTLAASAMTDAVKALQGAGKDAAKTMQKEVTTALATGVADSQRTFKVALEESGESLRSTAAGLSKAVADQARSVATRMGDSAEGFATAAAPVAQAAQAVGEAANRVARAIEAGGQAESEALKAMSDLAEGVKETHAAAEDAWHSYRARFEGVDKALESTVIKLEQALEGSLNNLQNFANTFDGAMAGAVGKLSTTLSVVEDHADALEGTTESLTKYAASLDRYARSGAGSATEPAE